MGRNLNQVIADLPAERLAEIDARYRVMKGYVEGMSALRGITGETQAKAVAHDIGDEFDHAS